VHEQAGPEPTLPPSGEGTVVLDVGGLVGAAVIYTDPKLNGQEIEIAEEGTPWQGVHTGIRQRELRDEVIFAAVFGSIAAGDYQLRIKGVADGPVVSIRVPAGGVFETNWPKG
jgi:hypothetical protein